MEQYEVHEKLKELIEFVKDTSFDVDRRVDDDEALGIMISEYFGGRGIPIMRTAGYALEDANYHDQYETLRETFPEVWVYQSDR